MYMAKFTQPFWLSKFNSLIIEYVKHTFTFPMFVNCFMA